MPLTTWKVVGNCWNVALCQVTEPLAEPFFESILGKVHRRIGPALAGRIERCGHVGDVGTFASADARAWHIL